MTDHRVELSHRFLYPWKLVTRAYLAKYPHKKMPDLSSVDTLERYVDQEGRIITSRIMISSLAGLTNLVGYEESCIDQSSQSIITVTRNKTHTSMCETLEKCQYISAGPFTDYSFEADMKAAFGLGFFLKLMMSTIKSRFYLGTKIIEDILVKKLGQARYYNIEDFSEKWGLIDEKKRKIKMLKQGLGEAEVIKYADFNLLQDILRVLGKCKSETQLISEYLQTEWHWIDRIKGLMDDEDRRLVRKLIDCVKEQNILLNYEDLLRKYGLK